MFTRSLRPKNKLTHLRVSLITVVVTLLSAQPLKADIPSTVNNYRDGSYVTSSHYGTTTHWYALAAERGDVSAQYNLGLMFKNGDGISKNDAAALRWWTLAAQQGHQLAALNIGVMHERGDTVQRDLATALKWYSLAEAQSHIDRLMVGGTKVPPTTGRWFPTNKHNCQIWNPIPQQNETVVWSGDCSQGKVQGEGRVWWIWDRPDGGWDFRTTEGEWRHGIHFGKMKITYEDGEVYLGDLSLITGEADGHGTITDTDGTKYTGQIKNGAFSGQGVATSVLGSKLANGTWSDGKFSGEGTIIYEDTDPIYDNYDQYTGDFKDGNYHGRGTFTWADGSKYVGEWRNNLRNGEGVFTYLDGTTHAGQWKDNQKHGEVIITYPNGDAYIGVFVEGYRPGSLDRVPEQRKRQEIKPLGKGKLEGIIGIWETKSDTGGVAVFDRGTFGRIVIFVQDNSYKAVINQYDWKDASIFRDKTEDGEYDWGWEDQIRYVPTKYIETKITDHGSIENFAMAIIEEACTHGEFDYCDQWSKEIYLSTQQEIINCLNDTENEVFTREQKTFGNRNYDAERVPKIWKCISSNQDNTFFKKRE